LSEQYRLLCSAIGTWHGKGVGVRTLAELGWQNGANFGVDVAGVTNKVGSDIAVSVGISVGRGVMVFEGIAVSTGVGVSVSSPAI